MFNVVVTDYTYKNLDIETKILEEIGAKVHGYQCKTLDEVKRVTENADAVLVTNFVSISKEVIDNLKNCKIIVKHGIGTDIIDIEAATKRGIMVANVPNYCLDEVSDHAVALALSLVRKITISDKHIRTILDHRPQDLAPIRALKGATVGIIGFGRIGRLTAKKMNAFGSNIVFYDPYFKGDYNEGEVNAKNVGMDELLQTSDIVIIHAPYTKENYHMIDKSAFSKMTKKPYLINVGRGELINNEDLIEAIENGTLSGAGLDVIEGMPPVKEDNKFFKYENIVLTPHDAWYSERSLELLQEYAAYQVRDALTGKTPTSLVNKEVLDK